MVSFVHYRIYIHLSPPLPFPSPLNKYTTASKPKTQRRPFFRQKKKKKPRRTQGYNIQTMHYPSVIPILILNPTQCQFNINFNHLSTLPTFNLNLIPPPLSRRAILPTKQIIQVRARCPFPSTIPLIQIQRTGATAIRRTIRRRGTWVIWRLRERREAYERLLVSPACAAPAA
jgi:hypothetical protein